MAVRSPQNKKKVDRFTAVRIGGLVPCDYRTVESYFAGRRTPFAIAAAVRQALATLGIPDPRAEASAPTPEAR
ncbi:MAG: hypothetical protein WDO69_05560 [Pseudomonadota bacterium]